MTREELIEVMARAIEPRCWEMMDEVMARAIEPRCWEVMDAELNRMLQKYKGQEVAYPSDQFQHKESMATARKALAAIEAAGVRLVPVDMSRHMLLAAHMVERDDIELTEDEQRAMYAAVVADRAYLLRALDEAQERAERAEAALANLADCQPLPKVYKYTGTAEVDVENMFDVGHRHRNGKQPRDYLMSWLSMFRPFAYATKDDSWGELEKLISITMNNYVQILVKAEKARAAQTLKERNDG